MNLLVLLIIAVGAILGAFIVYTIVRFLQCKADREGSVVPIEHLHHPASSMFAAAPVSGQSWDPQSNIPQEFLDMQKEYDDAMDRKKRRVIIKGIIVKKVVMKMEDEDNESISIPSMKNGRKSIQTNKSNNILTSSVRSLTSIGSKVLIHFNAKATDNSSSNFYSPRCCPICLEDYEEDDQVCFSKNDDCPHMYHLECLMDWLMKHDDCPMCRLEYYDAEQGNKDTQDCFTDV